MYFSFALGFVTGVYFASKYECKPLVDGILKFLSDRLPEEKK